MFSKVSHKDLQRKNSHSRNTENAKPLDMLNHSDKSSMTGVEGAIAINEKKLETTQGPGIKESFISHTDIKVYLNISL